MRTRNATPEENAVVGTWKRAHVDEKIAHRSNELAKSPIAHIFKEEDLDVLRTEHGKIIAREQKGQIDYERLAREQLGAAFVDTLKEQYRKPSSKGPRALDEWAAEAGL